MSTPSKISVSEEAIAAYLRDRVYIDVKHDKPMTQIAAERIESVMKSQNCTDMQAVDYLRSNDEFELAAGGPL